MKQEIYTLYKVDDDCVLGMWISSMIPEKAFASGFVNADNLVVFLMCCYTSCSIGTKCMSSNMSASEGGIASAAQCHESDGRTQISNCTTTSYMVWQVRLVSSCAASKPPNSPAPEQ
jgi:hypothetical protein